MRTSVIPWIFAIFLLTSGGAALAQTYDAPPPSLDRILPQVRQNHPGKFYDAQGPWRGPDGRYRYRLKWMTPSGRIVWFDADAHTGRVLGPDFKRRGNDSERPHFRDDDRWRFPDNERRWNRGGRWPGEGRPHGGRSRRGR
jgi:hypothetical protein